MKLNKIFLLAGIALAGVFASCSDDDDYAKGPVASGNELKAVTFGTDNMFSTELDPADPTTYAITLYRDSAYMAEPLSVDLKVLVNTDEVFVVPATANFEAGKAETQVIVTFDKAEIGVPYTLEVAVDEAYVHPYKANSTTSYVLNLQRVKWNKLGLGTFNDTFLNGAAYYVEIEQRDGTYKFRMLEPYAGANADPDNWDGGLVQSTDKIFFEILPKTAQKDADGDVFYNVTFDTWATGYWYQGALMVYACWESDYNDDTDGVYYPDYNLIYLYPAYDVVGLGTFGVKPVVVTLPTKDTPEGVKAGDLVVEAEEEEGEE
jgi:hypothetical protein